MTNFTDLFSADAMESRSRESRSFRVREGLAKYSTKIQDILDSIVAEANKGKRQAHIHKDELSSPDGLLHEAVVYLLYSAVAQGGLGYWGEDTDGGLSVRW